MLLNKLSVRYNTPPIMPGMKTQLSTHFEGFFSQKNSNSKSEFSTLKLVKTSEKNLEKNEEKSFFK